MARIGSINPEHATGRAKDLLEATNQQLGRIPNLYRSMAQSPAALEGYLSFRGALGRGMLSLQMRERIALLTAAINDCGYCVSAHTLRGAKVGISEADMASTQRADSAVPKEAAALKFVNTLVRFHGLMGDVDFANAKSQGWTDEEIGEMVAHVALNIFSNYFNHVAKPDLDFPPVGILSNQATGKAL